MTQFAKGIGLLTATTLIMGSAIGSGIFLLPSAIAGHVQAPGLLVLVFVAGAIMSFAGALTFAEMGAMFPRAGGQYVFLREAFGDGPAFLYGWMMFWVAITGIIAAVATAFAIYVGYFFKLSVFETRLVAVACIGFLTLVNALGVKHGGTVNNVFTIAKVGAIAALVILGFALGNGTGELVTPVLPPDAGLALVSAFGFAVLLSLFAFDGWSSVTFVAAEIKNPQRTIPLAAFLGVLGVTVVYLAANLVYLHILPIDAIAASPALASDVASAFLGPNGGALIAAAIVVSTFGTVNAFILQGPRIYHAMAESGLFYRGFGRLDAKRAVPTFGLIVQAEWAALLVLTGTYTQLVTYVTLAIWAFYGLAGFAYFRLRRKYPDMPRPYKTTGYPWVPGLFIGAAIFVVVNTLVFDTTNALFGLGLVATGIPVYWLMRRRLQAGLRNVPVDPPSPAAPAAEDAGR
ncbi:MAG TPA: amino acid permease [Candidatus Thermoplasmatota archaeon]|nr:amino acid permease [Candidatus Thermoplasmatota archaeon]